MVNSAYIADEFPGGEQAGHSPAVFLPRRESATHGIADLTVEKSLRRITILSLFQFALDEDPIRS